MGIFSKSAKGGSDHREGPDAPPEDVAGQMEPRDTSGPETSNVQHLSPFALKMQEKMHQLDGLKSRLGSLSQGVEQMHAMAAESRHSLQMMTEFIEASRVQVETEIRLKSENAKISTDLLDANHRLGTLANQLEEAQAESHSLRKRLTESRTALETARNELVSIRDNNKKVNEDFRTQSAELVLVNGRATELADTLGNVKAKFSAAQEQADSLQADLDEIRKREKELQQNLSESAALLEEEIRKNNQVTGELEALKRQLVDYRNENIDLKSHLDVANQELAYSKSRMEEEQRKHDNEVYALNAEIENLSSQRRIGAQALQDLSQENQTMKERKRDLVRRMQEIEQHLANAQKNHERDRNELVSANAKLRELNLRYNSALTDLNHERNQNVKFAERMEELIEENQKLQKYRIQVDTTNDQIIQLKGVINNYQRAMEGRGPAEELGLTRNYDPAEEAGLLEGSQDDGGPDDNGGDDDGVIVRLRD
ncbi:hypothetical protein SAMN05444272_2240 [Roseibium suaedae]|uniref:Uncharacterized protein n=2 Tax=Roseibium suaedae TaxID=735517 RepID=A0A1M7HIU6_9HYPH|nr:hypothetical protein SAMN05444272_2240 [Roseibium suaedae]